MKWRLKRKYQDKKHGVNLAVPGHLAGRPDLAEVSVTFKGDQVVEGRHWALWNKYLDQVAEPVIHKTVDVIVDVIKSAIPGPVDDIILEAGQPSIEKALGGLVLAAVDKVSDALDGPEEPESEEESGEPKEEEVKDPQAQSTAGDGASKLRRLRKKKTTE